MAFTLVAPFAIAASRSVFAVIADFKLAAGVVEVRRPRVQQLIDTP
jgi:hypothetical protein